VWGGTEREGAWLPPEGGLKVITERGQQHERKVLKGKKKSVPATS